MSELAPSTPILDALMHLRDTTRLTLADFDALINPLPAGVRVLDDLRVVVERGEIADKKLEKKLKGLL
jgi:hypothetical protein